MPVYIEKSGDLVGCHHSGTTKQGKIELLSQWTMDCWDEQLFVILINQILYEYYVHRMNQEMRVIKYNVSIIKIRSCFLICTPLFNSNLQLNLPSWRRPFHPDFNLLMEENGVGWHSGEEGPWPALLVLVGISLQLNTKYYALYRNIILYRILYIVIYFILNLIYWMAFWALGWKDLDQALWCLWGNYSVFTHHATTNTIMY